MGNAASVVDLAAGGAAVRSSVGGGAVRIAAGDVGVVEVEGRWRGGGGARLVHVRHGGVEKERKRFQNFLADTM